jgi:hypothetical protein
VSDFESNLRILNEFQQTVILAPTRWHTFSPDPPLQWRCARFLAASAQVIPERAGVYAFVVQFRVASRIFVVTPHFLAPVAEPTRITDKPVSRFRPTDMSCTLALPAFWLKTER